MKQFLFACLAWAIGVGMIAVAEYSGEWEILFPEIAALTVGGILAPKTVWNTNKIQMLALMTLSSLLGIGFAALPAPLYVQAVLAFFSVSLLLTVFHTGFVPALSACVLPVYLGTTSWVYPLSVAVLTAIVCLVMCLQELCGKERRVFRPQPVVWTDWLKRLGVYAVVALLLWKGILYPLIPPLLVAFVEVSFTESKAREKLIPVWGLVAASAVLGFAVTLLPVPAFVQGGLALAVLFGLFRLTKLYFPPAGAVCLLPQLLPTAGLWAYALCVPLGCLVLFFLAIVLFPQKK